MKWLIHDLRTTECAIVTNLAVKFDPWVLGGKVQMGLDEYLRRVGYKGRPARERVRILDDDQVKHFWRCRAKTDMPPAELDPQKNLVSFPVPQDDGVIYYIDELHDHFNSHEWLKVGKEALYYISKHRHFADDVWGISQAMGNVVKQFRVLIQETHLVRNLAYEKWGAFKVGTTTIVKVFMYCPVQFKGEQAMYSMRIRFGVGGIQETYNTAAAAKGSQSKGDVGKSHVKGIPWWIGVLGFVAALVGLWWASGAIPKAILDRGKKASDSVTTNLVQRMESGIEAEVHAGESVLQKAESQVLLSADQAKEKLLQDFKPLYMQGYCQVGNEWFVLLSDGRVLRSSLGEFSSLSRDRVKVDGVWIPIARP